MRQQKQNNMVPRLWGLCLVLCLSVAVLAVGPAYARYQKERNERVTIQVTEPSRVVLGTVKDQIFTATDQLEWKLFDGTASLTFTMSNGMSDTSFSAKDQVIRLYMIGSQGIETLGAVPKVSVTYVSTDGEPTEITVNGVVSPILEGTSLYHTYGPGWMYTFYETTEADSPEISWELQGGQLSYLTVTVKAQGKLPSGEHLLQPLVSAELVK